MVLPHHRTKACLSFKAASRSRAALTYAEAQSRIDDDRLHDEISVNLRRLSAIARVLRAQRAKRGALQLASPEVKFEIDTETHDPLDVGMYQVLALRCHTRTVYCPAPVPQPLLCDQGSACSSILCHNIRVTDAVTVVGCR